MGYHHLVANPLSPIDDLRALLLQLRLPAPDSKTASDAARSQLDLLLARITALTESLRTAPLDGAFDSAARLLLADLAMVAAQCRGHTSELGERLAHALEHARLALEGSDKAAPIL